MCRLGLPLPVKKKKKKPFSYIQPNPLYKTNLKVMMTTDVCPQLVI